MKLRSHSVSLLWRILFSTSIAITVLFGAMGWLLQDQFVRIASATLEDEVRASFRAYESLWRARGDQLASVSLILSRLPSVRAAVGTGRRSHHPRFGQRSMGSAFAPGDAVLGV
jgi:hypothetical protein